MVIGSQSINEQTCSLVLQCIGCRLGRNCGYHLVGSCIEFLLEYVVGRSQGGVVGHGDILRQYLVGLRQCLLQCNGVFCCLGYGHRANLELCSVEVCAFLAEGIKFLLELCGGGESSSLGHDEAQAGIRAVQVNGSGEDALTHGTEGHLDVTDTVPVLSVIAGSHIHAGNIAVVCACTSGHIYLDDARYGIVKGNLQVMRLCNLAMIVGVPECAGIAINKPIDVLALCLVACIACELLLVLDHGLAKSGGSGHAQCLAAGGNQAVELACGNNGRLHFHEAEV